MHKGKLLLVSESPAEAVAACLERSGFGVASATSIQDAALAALEHKPDGVLFLGRLGPEWDTVRGVLSERFRFVEIEEVCAEQASQLEGEWNAEDWLDGAMARNGHPSAVSSLAATGEVLETLAGGSEGEEGGRWKTVALGDLAYLIEKRLRVGMPKLQHFYTKVGNKLRRVEVKDIRFIEVEGKYSAIHVAERKYNVKASLKDLLHKLPEQLFVRVSRNYVVNVDRIEHIDTFQYTVRIGELEIPISRTYKENLMRFIQLL